MTGRTMRQRPPGTASRSSSGRRSRHAADRRDRPGAAVRAAGRPGAPVEGVPRAEPAGARGAPRVRPGGLAPGHPAWAVAGRARRPGLADGRGQVPPAGSSGSRCRCATGAAPRFGVAHVEDAARPMGVRAQHVVVETVTVAGVADTWRRAAARPGPGLVVHDPAHLPVPDRGLPGRRFVATGARGAGEVGACPDGPPTTPRHRLSRGGVRGRRADRSRCAAMCAAARPVRLAPVR